jgi:hypothetical protein
MIRTCKISSQYTDIVCSFATRNAKAEYFIRTPIAVIGLRSDGKNSSGKILHGHGSVTTVPLTVPSRQGFSELLNGRFWDGPLPSKTRRIHGRARHGHGWQPYTRGEITVKLRSPPVEDLNLGPVPRSACNMQCESDMKLVNVTQSTCYEG